MSHDRERPSRETLDWVARQVHPRARIAEVVSLRGGITAAMDRLTVESAAGPHEVVLRRWPAEDWTKGLVRREADALEAIRGHAVPAPRLVALDDDGAEAGVRCTLTTAVPGAPDLTPTDLPSWLEQLARTQAAIHAVPHHPTPRWTGWYGDGVCPLSWLTDPGVRAAAQEAAGAEPVEAEVLVHGDYQHFNILWSAGRLTAVVDWPNAATGNRGSDVGHCRLNLAVLLGAESAADYLVRYERAAGVRVDRRADLRALLCFGVEWQEFIPRQVDGRAPVDVAGMPGRVAQAVRDSLDGLG